MGNENEEKEGEPKPASGIARRGFASMTPERRKAIASEGGKRAHEKGTARQWTAEEAKRQSKRGVKRRRELLEDDEQ